MVVMLVAVLLGLFYHLILFMTQRSDQVTLELDPP
jgi:hypothetical protein